jgi:hypothetical protein
MNLAVLGSPHHEALGRFLCFHLHNDARFHQAIPSGGVILVGIPDHFLICGLALGQILANIGGSPHLWLHVLQFKIFVAPWANP